MLFGRLHDLTNSLRDLRNFMSRLGIHMALAEQDLAGVNADTQTTNILIERIQQHEGNISNSSQTLRNATEALALKMANISKLFGNESGNVTKNLTKLEETFANLSSDGVIATQVAHLKKDFDAYESVFSSAAQARIAGTLSSFIANQTQAFRRLANLTMMRAQNITISCCSPPCYTRQMMDGLKAEHELGGQ